MSRVNKPSTTTLVCKCHETPVPEKRSSQFHKPTMKGLIFLTNFSPKRDEGGSRKGLWGELVSRQEERDKHVFFPWYGVEGVSSFINSCLTAGFISGVLVCRESFCTLLYPGIIISVVCTDSSSQMYLAHVFSSLWGRCIPMRKLKCLAWGLQQGSHRAGRQALNTLSVFSGCSGAVQKRFSFVCSLPCGCAILLPGLVQFLLQRCVSHFSGALQSYRAFFFLWQCSRWLFSSLVCDFTGWSLIDLLFLVLLNF